MISAAWPPEVLPQLSLLLPRICRRSLIKPPSLPARMSNNPGPRNDGLLAKPQYRYRATPCTKAVGVTIAISRKGLPSQVDLAPQAFRVFFANTRSIITRRPVAVT
jgi:hypothetical protein